MPDIWDADDVSAFELPGDSERLAAIATATAEAEPAAQDAAGQTEPPRDEKGRFAPAEKAAEAETADEEAEAAEDSKPEDDPIERLLSKYGGDQRKALEAALEAQRTIGSMEKELGDLRAQAARAQELERYLQQAQQAQQAQAPSPEEWETLLTERPAEAARMAYAYGQQTNDWRYWFKAAEAWDEAAPGAPELWQAQQALIAENRRLSEYLDQQVLGQKVNEVAQKLGGVSEELIELLPDFPLHMRLLADPRTSPDDKAEILKALELSRRGLSAGTLAKEAQETVRKLASEEQRAASEAAVVTASRTMQEPAKSLSQRVSEGWFDDEARWNEGWNI